MVISGPTAPGISLRRMLWRFAVLWFFLMAAPAWAGWFTSANLIEVDIQVVDEAGKPLPHVTVWRFLDPYAPKWVPGGPMTMEDLWRMTLRYQDSFELAYRYHKPVRSLLVPQMADEQGHSLDEIDYQDESGNPRPERVTVGYSFMKRGYLPEQAQIVASSEQSRFALKITLKRNPAVPEDTSYLRAFERIRYELSDWRKNGEVSLENHRRLERLHAELESAAEEALRQGDKPAAARMYARLQYVPEVILENGRPVDAPPWTRDSPRKRTAFDKAARLDPYHPYIWVYRVIYQGYRFAGFYVDNPDATPARKKEFLDQIKAMEAVLEKQGEFVWPDFYDILAGYYMAAGQYEKAYVLYRREERFEPRNRDYREAVKGLKLNMKIKGVKAPDSWN